MIKMVIVPIRKSVTSLNFHDREAFMKKLQAKEKKGIRQVIWLAVVSLLIIATMTMIMSFSAESKESSGERSHGVTEQVVEMLVPGYSDMAPDEQTELIGKFHRPIRKLAHFSEFGLLGMLCAVLMHILGKGKYWLYWVIPTAFCLLFATADEVFQIFTHRGASPQDVLIDF